MSYKLRSDNTVLTMDLQGNQIVYRLRQQGGTAMEATKVASPSQRAVWGTDPTVYYDSTASDMLAGNAPKEAHGFLGFLGGLASGGLLLGGPAGWIGGAIAGLVVGHLISTSRSDVQMSPKIQVP